MKYLLDTDVLIEIFRNNAWVRDAIAHLRRGGHVLSYSPVTRAEIYAGMREGEELAIEQFLSRLTCAISDAQVGELAGRYLRTYRSSHALQMGDALIASTAVLMDAALITFNTRRYPMPNLRLHMIQRSAKP